MTVTFETERPADYLRRLADSEVGQSYKSRVLDELQIRPGHRVVDIGCGPGVDLPAFAGAAGADGWVVGVDRDAVELDEARGRLTDIPSAGIELGDASALPVASQSIDRAHTDRVLQHVEDPAAVLDEVRRVLRPGGRAVFAEPDWGTLVIDHDDHRLSDTYRDYVVDHVVRNSRIGRQLPRLAGAAGLQVEHVVPITTVFLDMSAADAVLGFGRVTARATDAGFFAPADAEVWLEGVCQNAFFASVTMFVTTVAHLA